MRFRPCIDIHNGKVKQIVGGSIDETSLEGPKENYVAEQDAAFFAKLYKKYNLVGGHIIILNKSGTPEYELTQKEAFNALSVYASGLQVGGGITAENAYSYIEAGASHVIVTSYVFRDGIIDYDRLDKLVNAVGREHIVLDLSCRMRDGKYFIVTDRWQVFTREELNVELLQRLEQYCSEYLIHAVDVEGKQSGVDINLVRKLGIYRGALLGEGPETGIPITYAGGVHSYEDIQLIKDNTAGRVDVTIGSALDLFGGDLEFTKILDMLV